MSVGSGANAGLKTSVIPHMYVCTYVLPAWRNKRHNNNNNNIPGGRLLLTLVKYTVTPVASEHRITALWHFGRHQIKLLTQRVQPIATRRHDVMRPTHVVELVN